MKSILTLGALFVLAIPSIAFAEGGSDRLIERMTLRTQAQSSDQENAEENIGNTVKSKDENAGKELRSTVKSKDGARSKSG
ncbi:MULTISPECIES: co-regulatory protein PtrA N-terminal domain-containing protein [Pseudomonas]|uniref:Secreted protein n=1 Tax=Pseudomonas fluorescens TaxID=294 RepID=A0A5E6PIC5_PSEFL|nr:MULTISPECIES: co-regulatory protein PtrA N-terminal domain-containing protein [Pseudomonas]VVM42427.1 hypothetical protein PS652_00335 [Pseudomonas fluorescens]